MSFNGIKVILLPIVQKFALLYKSFFYYVGTNILFKNQARKLKFGQKLLLHVNFGFFLGMHKSLDKIGKMSRNLHIICHTSKFHKFLTVPDILFCENWLSIDKKYFNLCKNPEMNLDPPLSPKA